MFISNMTEKFSLKWNNFHSNVVKTFSNLRHEDDFYDVTLVGDDQQQISAHKVVLSSCSEYFKNILRQNKHQHPLLCMEGINFNEMNSILNYIYHGQVNMHQDDLDRFLNVAQRLKLEGLISQDSGEEIKRQKDDYHVDLIEVIGEEYKEIKKYFTNSERNLIIPENKKFDTQKSKILIDSTEYDSIEELDAKILEYMEKDDDGKWKCIICQQKAKHKKDVKEHVEVHFDGLSFPCSDCDANPRSRRQLRTHIWRNHRS